MLTVEGSTQVFSNTLDLKNPFFRYNGTTATPPGHFSESPTEYFIANYANSHFSTSTTGEDPTAMSGGTAMAPPATSAPAAPTTNTPTTTNTTTTSGPMPPNPTTTTSGTLSKATAPSMHTTHGISHAAHTASHAKSNKGILASFI